MTTVLGFIVQCQICPQRAMVDTQPEEGWVCPRCEEVTEPHDAEPARSTERHRDSGWCGKHDGLYAHCRHLPHPAPGSFMMPGDYDGPDLRKIQG